MLEVGLRGLEIIPVEGIVSPAAVHHSRKTSETFMFVLSALDEDYNAAWFSRHPRALGVQAPGNGKDIRENLGG